MMWPHAKKGSHEAKYFLWSTLIGRMIPPGQAALSRELMIRHLLTLAAYTAIGPKGPKPFGGHPDYLWARKEIPLLIDQLGLGPPGIQVAQCYRSDRSFQECLSLAVSLDVVQPFEDYAAMVDSQEQESGRHAFCRPRP